MPRKNLVKPLALLSMAALVAAGLYLRWAPAAAPAAVASKPIPVSIALAERADVALKLETVGRAEAYESVAIKARIDGQVSSVPFSEGRHVKKGELLVQLDPATFAAQRRQAEAALARDQAQLAKARADVQRYSELRGKGFVSEEKVNEVRTNADAMAASVRADQASAELASLQESYTAIRAPFDGVVGSRLISPGTLVKNNDTTLTTVNRLKPMLVSFSVPEKHLPRLKASLRDGPIDVQITPNGGKSLSGKARFIDNAVDPGNGTILLKATLANEDEALTPGQFVNISLTIERLRDAITVPAQAVQQGQQGAMLFVADSAGKVSPRKVKVSATQGAIAIIGDGLAAGETVVTDGQLRLQPGSLIDLGASNATTPAAPSLRK